jgi:iron-sulfur cluster repair protein YtfE (RIC family)
MAVRRPIDPIARFMQEHDVTLMHLSSLNRATRALVENGYSKEAAVRVREAVGFLVDEVEVHNRHEEEALFPVLERYVEGPTGVMRDEHRTLKRELKKLRTAVERLSSPRPGGASLAAVRAHAQTVIQKFVNHIHKENNILFPLVQKFLTRDALREIARRLV